MKRIILGFLITCTLSLLMSIAVSADKVFEFQPKGVEESADGILSDFIEKIPPEIKKELPESREKIEFEEYGVDFFANKIIEALKSAVSPGAKTVSVLLSVVIIASVFKIFVNTVGGEGVKGTFSFCSSLCVALSVYSAMQSVFKTVEALLSTLTETMVIMISAMEAVYIQGGNLTTAAVTSTGVNIMIGFTQMLFSKVISPAVNIIFILCVVASVTKNKGIEFMVRTLRGIITGVIIAVMTLLSFVLALQSSGGAAADTFATRTVKFAIGNYLPIIGGTVADSFSLLSGSLSVIKQGAGIVGIAAILVAFLPPFATVLVNSIAVGLSGAAASVLGCDTEAALLSECKGICTLLLAVSVGAVVMYVIALGIFCKTPVAL